jgi:cell division protein FtsW (lipid II flippase)
MLATESDTTFVVMPDLGLILWTVYVATVLVLAVVTGLKGRWIWLLVGLLLLGGLPLFYAAFLPPEPDSVWAAWTRRRARRRAASA